MKSAKSLSICLLGVLAGSCGNDRAAKSAASVSDSTFVKNPVASVTKQPDACSERIKAFLNWYLIQTDYEHPGTDIKSVSFKFPVSANTDSAFLAKLGPDDRSPTKYIQINEPSIDRYIESLKKSGYFSVSYLQEKKASLERRGKALNAAHMEDGEAEGFEADEIFWMMELYDKANISNLKPHSSPLKNNGVVYELPPTANNDNVGYLLYTKGENGRCVIDSIAHLRDGKPETLGNR
ncbi:hypothetical protein GCM10022408_06140 [Hymenobacter fastidiosus]|uniref:Lipoprotein n=1 Tax=Hymenobacter fastidiosus TaxID=486264 RepID=A0ABP7RJ66_9BACT